MVFKYITVTFNDFKSGVVTNRDILDEEEEDTIPVKNLSVGQLVKAYWQAEKAIFPAIIRRISDQEEEIAEGDGHAWEADAQKVFSKIATRKNEEKKKEKGKEKHKDKDKDKDKGKGKEKDKGETRKPKKAQGKLPEPSEADQRVLKELLQLQASSQSPSSPEPLSGSSPITLEETIRRLMRLEQAMLERKEEEGGRVTLSSK